MPRTPTSVYDGTTGGSDHGGRRTHIIQILRDAKEPLSVADVAQTVGVHINTARFHLESLVDAGLATRQSLVSDRPGRRRIVYKGTLPNQTHERAQGYRLLSEILTSAIAAHFESVDDALDMYAIGRRWGSYLTNRPAPFETFDEAELADRVVDKLDALWFAPELRDEPRPHVAMHNCPFASIARSAPQVVCQLHVGMINGSLDELHSRQRIVSLEPGMDAHVCRGWLGACPADELTTVPITAPSLPAGAPAGRLDDPEDLAGVPPVPSYGLAAAPVC